MAGSARTCLAYQVTAGTGIILVSVGDTSSDCALSDEFRHVQGEDDLLKQSIRSISRRTNIDWVAAYQVNAAESTILFNPRYVTSKLSSRLPGQISDKPRDVGWRAGIVGRAARSKERLLISADIRGGAGDVEHDCGRFQEAIAVPIVSNGTVIAVLVAGNASRPIGEDVISQVCLVAAVAAAHTFRIEEFSRSTATNRHLARFYENLPAMDQVLREFREDHGVLGYLKQIAKLTRKLLPADGVLILTHNVVTNGIVESQCYFVHKNEEKVGFAADDVLVELARRLQPRQSGEVEPDLSNYDTGPLFKMHFRHGYLSAATVPLQVHPPDDSVLVLFSLERNAYSKIDVTLLHFVRELTAILSDAHEMAVAIAYHQRTVVLAHLIAGINHEIRNWNSYVINDVNHVTEMLDRIPLDPLDEDSAVALLSARKNLASALKNGDKVAQKLDILKHFRWREEDFQLTIKDVDLNLLVRQIGDACAKSLEEKQLTLVYSMATSLPTIKSDLMLIEECMSNLLLNAIYFTRPFGRIEVGTKYDERESAVSFWVRDQGGGIHKKDQVRIYLPFYSTKKSNDRGGDHSGSGIGLFLTKNNVKLLRGTIALESVVPQWSQFTITLPLELVDESTNE